MFDCLAASLDDIQVSRGLATRKNVIATTSCERFASVDMRSTTRLLAQASRYLEVGAPTGLTGLFTHASPRSTLMYTYNSTLDKLKQLPESSVYRQSVEALTKHRLSIIEAIKPEGLEQWQERTRKMVEANPLAFRIVNTQTNNKEVNFVYKHEIALGMDNDEYSDEPVEKPEVEGPRSIAEKARQGKVFSRDLALENARFPRIEPEPPFSAEQ